MGFLIRFLGYLFSLGIVFAFIGFGAVWALYQYVNRDLPDIASLQTYAPPVMTRVHAADGNLIAEYAREPRLFLPIRAIPALVKNAFISAEDKNFYDHPGIDPEGVARAVINNVQDLARGAKRRPEGASTITQQVAKNFLLSPEASLERKAKEAILALRIERALTKDQILELYLNEIFLGSLGRQAYGIAAASLLYFDKSVHELTVSEAAYLAALPKAPNNYHPFRHPERAVGRRNDIIDLMMRNGHITREQGEKAKGESLVVTPRTTGPQLFASDYFAEEVRRELGTTYGEKGLYEGGLSVRTTLDPKLQVLARKALMNGLIRFDEELGYRGAVATIDLAAGDWGIKLFDVKALSDVPEWRLAVVLAVSDQEAQIGLQPQRMVTGAISQDRERGVVTLEGVRWAKAAEGARRGVAVRTVGQVLNPGDVVYVEKQTVGDRTFWRLRQNPEIGGAMVVMDPQTGRVLALAGGFSFAESEFNRATQAFRQPGSSFKPFIYAAALDNGYTPSSLILDGPIELPQGPGLPPWRPENYSGKFNGPTTLRAGIEQSRNTMTVRLAKDMGMPIVVEYAKRFGIYENLAPFLSNSLGAGETTVLRLTTAYATIANGGRKVKWTLIDRIQDRHGRTIFKHDQRQCAGCQAVTWSGQQEPDLVDEREQVLDPLTAYQMTYIMEGVIQRGTATTLRELNRPIAGKTGTSNDEKDAWFVGYTPDLAVGVFVGYDRPRPMGKGRTGGVLAAPIFKEFVGEALKGKAPVPFKVPEGIRLITIDRKTGLRAGAGEGAFPEAFKPGTAPPDNFSVIGFETADTSRPRRVTPEIERQLQPGGLY